MSGERTFIEQYSGKIFQKNAKKSKNEIIKNLTHLYLNGRHIEEIGNLASAKRLTVLYLHMNSIRKIENVNSLSNLTHLYLQWNRIKRIENLNGLKQLRKLYLSYNEIEHLENIEELNQLEELHLERQNLTDEFTFSLDSLVGISKSLKVLNISGLKLSNLAFMSIVPNPIYQLQELIASDNMFNCTEDITISFTSLPKLFKANFIGCLAQSKDLYYRNKITSNSNSLEILDDKPIQRVTRCFLKCFEQSKLNRKSRTVSDAQTSNVVKSIYEMNQHIFWTAKLTVRISLQRPWLIAHQ